MGKLVSKPEIVDPDRYFAGEFTATDFNNDGKIFANQFLRLITFLGYDGGPEKAHEILASIGKDVDSALTKDEYIRIMKTNEDLAEKTKRVRAFFSRFDDKEDGKVPISHVLRGFETMGFDVDEELKGKIETMDKNKDGMISYSEFLQAQLIQKKVLRPSEAE